MQKVRPGIPFLRFGELGVFENANILNRDWNGIWQVGSRIDALGWTAEVAIPFNTLNIDIAAEAWGFTIALTIARKQEEQPPALEPASR